MVTFSGELGTTFPITLEANHVVKESQVWVGTLSNWPTGKSFNGTFRHAQTPNFQDETGRLVLTMCKKVPHGVLVFFSSYKMLNRMIERWKTSQLWRQIQDEKEIVSEPKYGKQLDGVMEKFYAAINESKSDRNLSFQTGALFLAVFRGKVSEGLDFADNNARAVICVGIPFPALTDPLVELKRQYNDVKQVTNPNILSGQKWYEIQAFRALNQALGRCIRHKNDWGAILMVDERYNRNQDYVNSLSKWVRGNVVHYYNCNQMTESLQTFVADMKGEPSTLNYNRDGDRDRESFSQNLFAGSSVAKTTRLRESSGFSSSSIKRVKIEYDFLQPAEFQQENILNVSSQNG